MYKSTLAVVLGIAAQCGFTSAHAEQSRRWEMSAVLYAEVGDIEKVEQGQHIKLDKEQRASEWLGECIVHLKPLATLTGNFDAALHEEISAWVHIGRDFRGSEIRQAPTEGAKVIALVYSRSGKYHISHLGVDFFPEDKEHRRPAMFQVTSFEDPKVSEVSESLRKLRAPKDAFIESIERLNE